MDSYRFWDGTTINYATNRGTAKAGTGGSFSAYNYKNPGNMNYENQNNATVYSGTIKASSGIAIGENATTETTIGGKVAYSSGVAIGDFSKATGGLSFALGAYSQATDIGATVIGTAGLASGFNSLAMMRQSAAKANYAMAIGTASWADGVASLAMGSSATAKGKQSIAIGSSDMLAQDSDGNGRASTKYDGTNNTQANGIRAIAIGTTARTNADDTIAFGTRTESTVGGAISMGFEAKSKALDAIAIGSRTQILTEQEKGSIAIGNQAGKQGFRDYAVKESGYNELIFDSNIDQQQDKIEIGTNSYAYGHDSIAIGTRSQAVFNNSTDRTSSNSLNSGAVAIGYQAISKGDQAVSLGSRAEALNRQAMALGNDAFASGVGAIVIGGDDSLPSESTEAGYRLETGFASGNKYRQSVSTGNGAVVVGVHSQALSQGSTAIGIAATAGDNGEVKTKDNVTTATAAKEATAVGAKSRAKSAHTTAVGYEAEALGLNSTTVGAESTAESENSFAGGYNATANGTNSTAIGSSAQTKGDDAIAIGTGAKALNKNTISIGTGNTVNGENSGAIGDPTVVNGTNSYSVGNNNVLASDNTFVLGNSVRLNQNAKNSTVIGNQNNINLIGTADETGYVNVQGDHNTINAARGIGILGNNNIVQDVTHDVFILGNNVKKTANDSVFLGSGSGYVAEGATTKGLEKTYTFGTVNDKTVQFAGGDVTAGVVSVGGVNDSKQQITRRIQNVAPGLISDKSTDAINGSQLHAIAEALRIHYFSVNSQNGGNYNNDGAKGIDAIAIGKEARANGLSSVALGLNAATGDVDNATGIKDSVGAVAVGNNTRAIGNNTVAIGQGAKAYRDNAIAIGNATIDHAAKENNMVFGSGATITRGSNSIVMGTNSKSEATNGSSIAIGENATISSAVTGNAYVIGTNASIDSTNGGIAFGNSAKITNSNGGEGTSVAIGEGAVATGTRAISLGYKAGNGGSQVDSIAIGSSATTSGENNIAIGKNAKASGSQGNQIVVGSDANAGDSSQYSIVMGSGASATREYSTVLGSNANSIADGGVALGANSVSDRQAGGSATGHASTKNPYIPVTANESQKSAINATIATTGAVSVGSSTVKRQITNLAAGAEDTDAVNVAQLKAAVTTAVASSTWNIKENTTQKDVVNSGDNVSFDNGTGTTATVEVADSGKTSTVKYSVNKSELSVTGGKVTAGKEGDNFATAEEVADAINDSEKTSSVVSSTKTIEVTSKVSGNNTEYDLDLSEATKTSLGKADTALQSWEAQANGNKVKTVNKDNTTLNFVNGKNIHVTNDNGQVKIATVDAPTFTTVNAENFTTGTVSITDNGINAGNQTISNVKDGTISENSKEAVNGSQLYKTNQNVANNTANITKNAENIAKGTVYAGDYAQDSKVSNNFTQALGNQTNIVGGASQNDLSEKNIGVVSNGANTLTVKLAKTLSNLTNATFGNNATDQTVINKDGVTITNGTNTVTLTENGLNNGGNKITNVANGTLSADSKDAVNGSQLYAVSEVANAGWTIQANGQNGSSVTPSANNVSLNNTDSNIVISKAANNNNVTFDLNNTLSVGGSGKAGSITLNAADDTAKVVLNGANGSVKTGDTLMNNDGVKVGTNVSLTSDGLTAGDVIVSATGINAGSNQITNVSSGLGGTTLSNATGATLTNAANIGDLKMVVLSITNATQGGGFGLSDDSGINNVTQSLGSTIQVKGDGKNISTVVKDSALTVNLNKDVDLGNDGSLTIGNTTINSDQVKVGDVTVSSNGKVSGVADGDISPNSTQAINGSQLYDANLKIATYLGGNATVDSNGNITKPTYTITKVDGTNTTVNNVGDAITNLNNEVVKPLTFAGDTGVSSERKLGSTVTVKGGVQDSSKLSENNIGVVSDGKGTLAVKLAKDIKVDSVEAKTVNANTVNANTVKAGDTTINSDGVTIKDGPSVTKSGINAAGNRITNVKAGQADTDAVNVSQLKGAVGHVNQRINKVNKELRAGIAGANAAAGLPQAYIPGKSMMAVAAGTYKNESALAVGYSRSSDNGKVILKLQGNANTRGDLGGSVGVGYQW